MSSLPQGFSIFQPALGAQLQFFPAVGTQELDELIHAHLIGPASSQEKRATLALDFLEHAQMTGQSFKFYPVYTVAASPATSAASSFNTSPTTTSWDWSQTSRTASVSSRSSSQQQHHVSKPTSPASRMRATDFSSLPGMKIMTKDGLDVTNSASRGSKTKEQRDHAHLMRIIKACDSCKRKKIRCDPSHKKRAAAATPAAPLASSSKVTKKARTSSPTAPSQSVSPPQSISPQSVSPMLEEFGSFSASPFDMDATFSFDALETFDASLAAPSNPWDEFIQYPPMAEAEDYDFFADPDSYLSSQSSEAGMATSRLSASMSPTHSGAPPERGPDAGRAESHAQLLQGAALDTSVLAQQPWESQDSGVGDYTDFNLYSPGSTFSEDERMLDIGSSSASTQSVPSPLDSPPRPPNAESPAAAGADGVNAGDSATQSPFTRAEQTGATDRGHAQDTAAGGIAGALSVLSRSDVVMRTNEQGQLIICCPPGTVVVNSSGSHGSSNAGLTNVSLTPPPTLLANRPRLTFWKVSTVNDSSSSSFYIPHELSVRAGLRCPVDLPTATNPMKDSAVASVSSAAATVDATVNTWLDHGEEGQSPQLATTTFASNVGSPTQLADGIGRSQSSRFVHRNTDLAQPLPVVVASPTDAAATNDGLAVSGLAVSPGLATGLSTSSSASASAASSAGRVSATSTQLATQLDEFASATTNGLATRPSSPASPVSASGLSVTASPVLASALSPSPVDVLGGYVSDESGSQPQLSDGISDATRRTPDASSSSSETDDKARIDQSTSDDSRVAAPAPATDEGTVSSVAPSIGGRPVEESESPFEVSQTAASTISQRDTTGIGRSLSSSRDASSPVSAADLAVLMQTVLTRTLVVAAYAQSSLTKTEPSSRRNTACREYAPRARSVLAPFARVPVVC
ncbi:hypothetical protein PWT90_03079 [Aphanocladium album]|nr:hypothetical protein PWT90_03079 [Aphanocladium album]